MENKPPPESSRCLNCEQPLSPEAGFCSACGQKRTTGRISFQQLFADFFENVFNLDSRVFLTLRMLAIPGRLTTEYFRGRHRTYLHPFRLFLVALIALVAAVSWELNEGIVKDGDLMSRVSKARIERALVLEVDSLNQHSQTEGEKVALHAALDSLKKEVYTRNGIKGDSVDLDRYFTLMGEDFDPIHIEDALSLDADELIRKYKIEGTKRKWILRQKIKVLRDSRSFIRFLIGRISWMGLVLIPFLALGLKLLYWRKEYFYVEHFIFSIHTHTVFFFLAAFQSILLSVIPPWSIAISSIGFAVYLLYAIRNFYGQSWWKTLLKFTILTSIINWICLFFSLLVAIVLGVLFF